MGTGSIVTLKQERGFSRLSPHKCVLVVGRFHTMLKGVDERLVTMDTNDLLGSGWTMKDEAQTAPSSR